MLNENAMLWKETMLAEARRPHQRKWKWPCQRALVAPSRTTRLDQQAEFALIECQATMEVGVKFVDCAPRTPFSISDAIRSNHYMSGFLQAPVEYQVDEQSPISEPES